MNALWHKPFSAARLHQDFREGLRLLLLVPSWKSHLFRHSSEGKTSYKLIERRPANHKCNVTSVHIIEVGSRDKTLPRRRVGYRDPTSGKRYEFLTNHFRLSPKTIADICKGRWQIEIFFREIKQNLCIKLFVGSSENAVSSKCARVDNLSAHHNCRLLSQAA